MFPISDSPNPRGLAVVTIILIALNAGTFLALLPQMGTSADPGDPRLAAYVEVLEREGRISPREREAVRRQVSAYDLTVFEYGSRPAQWSLFTMLTSMFMHGGWMHLLGNMLFLWIYGNNVEHRSGRLAYLVAYLATGYAASFGDVLLRPGSNVPGVGASGAISGVLGMYFLWFPRNQVRLLVLIPPFIQTIDVGARWVLGFYLVVQNVLPALLGGGEGGIAYGAHIGGFLGGLAWALADDVRLRAWPGRRRVEGEEARPGEVAEAAASGVGLLGQYRNALARGDVHGASRLFFGGHRALLREGATAADAVRLGNALAAAGQPQGAVAAYQQALRLAPEGTIAAAAHLGAARVQLHALGQPTMAYQHLHGAVGAGLSGEQMPEARALLEEVRRQTGTLPRRSSRWE